MKKAHKFMKKHLELFDWSLFLKEILIFYVLNTWNYLYFMYEILKNRSLCDSTIDLLRKAKKLDY